MTKILTSQMQNKYYKVTDRKISNIDVSIVKYTHKRYLKYISEFFLKTVNEVRFYNLTCFYDKYKVSLKIFN